MSLEINPAAKPQPKPQQAPVRFTQRNRPGTNILTKSNQQPAHTYLPNPASKKLNPLEVGKAMDNFQIGHDYMG